MKFKDMKYTRPDIDEAKKDYKEYTDQFKNASTYEEARKIFIERDKLDRHIVTESTLVSIRHSIDTKDEFYDEENKFWNNIGPSLSPFEQEWNNALLNSKFRKELEEEFGNVFFINAELQIRSFKDELIPYMQKQNELTDEYEVLLSSAKIEFEGKTYTLSQLTPFKNSLDDDIRLKAWKAEGKWYKDNQEKLDSIYDELVKIRDQMGKIMGHENYVELGYDLMGRNCYRKNDVEKFREAVVKYLVPIADEIYKIQAQRIGKKYPLSYADEAIKFKSGNPKPYGSADDILKAGKKFYDELSPETSEFFNKMLDNELMDVLSTDSKATGGYCTGLPDYEVPFIFANFNGTQGDVEVVTHEAGHAFEAYTNRKRIPVSTIWPSMEACEVHSMSMEFFAWPWVEEFFKDDARKYLYSHLAGSVTFIPYGTLVDHFQHEVYEHPEYTPKQRHETWKRLQEIYMPWIRLDGDIPFYSEGEAWQRQHHIYSSPFYYIDYCLAQTVALSFWKMIMEDKDKAWQKYMDYTKLGGSMTFTDLIKTAKLDNPFEEDCLKSICEQASKWLKEYDLTGIE